MSPEQARGRELDARSDLFSFGVVLYEMATGVLPFRGDTPALIFEAILNRSPKPAARLNPELPPKLEDIIQKVLQKDCTLRYQHASELRADLRRVKRDEELAKSSGEGRRVTSPTEAARPAAAKATSIVVLPFSNMSSDPENEFFADGITEEIINALAQIDGLRVAARTSAFSFKGRHVDLRTVGESLNVTNVLEGSVRKSGNRLRITAQLINAADGYHLWSERYDRELQDIFEVQDEIAKTIAARLRIAFESGKHGPLVKTGTKNMEAYQLYLKGRFHWNKLTPEGFLKALEYFRQAVDRDPEYAPAYAGQADSYSQLSFFNVFAPRELMPKSKAAAEKALQINDRLAEAHVSLGYANFIYDFDWRLAGEHFEQALALNPAYTRSPIFYPLYLSSLGRSAEAIAVAKSAAQLDPISTYLSHSLAVQLYLAKEFDQSIEQCRRTLDLDTNHAVAYAVSGQAYAAEGMYREALEEIEKYAAMSRGAAMAVSLRGYVHGLMGEQSQALESIEHLMAASKQRYTPAFAVALPYAGLGDKGQTLAWLAKAYEERFARLAYIKQEAFWDPLRSDPRFGELVGRIGAPA
jgi:TolB-like protein/Tfp pilus assembly protein PilF